MRRRRRRITPAPQGESKSGGGRRQNLISARIQQLRNYQNQGLLEEEQVNNVVDNVLTTGTREAEDEFLRQARRLIRQADDNMGQQVSAYATQPEVPPLPEEEVVAETKAVEVQDDTPVVEADRYTYRVHSMRVAHASPLLEVVRTIQSEM